MCTYTLAIDPLQLPPSTLQDGTALPVIRVPSFLMPLLMNNQPTPTPASRAKFMSFGIFREFEFWTRGNCRYGHLEKLEFSGKF